MQTVGLLVLASCRFTVRTAKASPNPCLVPSEFCPSHPSSSRAHMQAVAFLITDYNYLEVQNTFRAVRECWPNADVRAALFNAGLAAGSHYCRSQK